MGRVDQYCIRPSAMLGLGMGRTDQYCVRPSAMLGLGQWVEQISTVLGLQLC